jgi:hypothetical protein
MATYSVNLNQDKTLFAYRLSTIAHCPLPVANCLLIQAGTSFMQLVSNPSSMFPLPTRIHAVLDYSFSLFLMLSPAIFGFGEAKLETIIPIASGMLICFYSFFTNYEGGLYRLFPLKLHYILDLGIGLLITTSPWVFGFRDIIYKPHLYSGLAFTIVSILNLLPLLKSYKFLFHRPSGSLLGSH